MSSTVKRTISGAAFILVMLAGLLINQYLFAALMAFVLVVMMNEFYNMTLGKGFKFIRWAAVLCGVYFFCAMYARSSAGLILHAGAFAIPAIVLICACIHVYDKENFGKVAYLFTGLVYIALPLSLSNCIVFRGGEYSGALLLAFFIIIWCSDTGAYCLGCTLGKNGKKMCPSISPNKSWWGFVGGLIFAVAAGAIMSLAGFLEFPLVHSMILGAIMHVFGVYGDLFESQWKRYYGIKDSGNIIPGHGGLLDRFDSSILAIPAGAVYLLVTGLF